MAAWCPQGRLKPHKSPPRSSLRFRKGRPLRNADMEATMTKAGVDKAAALNGLRRFKDGAKDHRILDVIEAAGITLATGIFKYARLNGMTEAQTSDYAKFVCDNVRTAVLRGYRIGSDPRDFKKLELN